MHCMITLDLIENLASYGVLLMDLWTAVLWI